MADCVFCKIVKASVFMDVGQVNPTDPPQEELAKLASRINVA